MTAKKLLTDRHLRSLPPAPKGKRFEVWDSRVPGFGIRITDIEHADPSRRDKAGKIIFVLYGRFQPGAAPTRRTIGTYGAISLEEAREIAGQWRSQIDKGIDPAEVERAQREAEAKEAALRMKHSFANCAEAFITEKMAHERRGKKAEPTFRSVFVEAWGNRPLNEITTADVLEIINAKKRSAPSMARALLGLIKRFFNWAIDQQKYGLDRSPCERLKASRIIGDEQSRTRRLNDAELFAFWRATGRMKYPAGPVYRLLLLTGCRLNEIAHLSWVEVHDDKLDIPASRMKGKNGKAREHLVPLSKQAKAIIASVPRIKGGKFLFSRSAGKYPATIGNEDKIDLDRRMLRTLKALAKRRGDDPETVEFPGWVIHDLRRVVRSGLSALRVPHNVAEAILAHSSGDIVGVYDTHLYLDEKREALEAWAQRINAIVNPVPANVIRLRGRQR